jgi:AraC-like DNA-binding protein
MEWKTERLALSLEKKPRLVQVNFGHHDNEKELFFQIKSWTLHLYFYGGNIRVNGADFPIRFGHLGINPPEAETLYRFDEPVCRHLYAHFEIPENRDPASFRRVPVMHDINPSFDAYNSRMDDMVKLYHRDRFRAEIILWELLLRLAESASTSTTDARPSVVEAAMDHIERNLSQFLPAASVAEAVGLSQNHLNRLFHAHLGKTLKDYIRDLRMEKAAYYLTATRLPIKAAAGECGIPDLQHFNKTVRRVFGKSPKKLRETGVAKPLTP